MGASKKEKGIFTKIWEVIAGKQGSDEIDQESGNLQYRDAQSKAVDLQFVEQFNASGGKFLYCEEEKEAYQYLHSIRQESSIERVFCPDDNFRSILQKAGIQLSENHQDADAFCSGCEYLVSFNGGIMLTDRQTRGLKYPELPQVFITLAHTSQITKNISSALSGIRQRYTGNLPSDISTIKGMKNQDSVSEPGGSRFVNKEIYLLLVEDQL